ncbi:hypothetical protein ACFQAV_05370 [Companilactobacillus huachuanensis]|uniref:Surface layer protein A domain-containing protein n=1 Tax=Companilactobacillus huachuanensis TaxID=2559914 RepID=A0ABW1RNR2_9LACO|nr:hypothetical protein [Companilactobacillus huachuanensis]
MKKSIKYAGIAAATLLAVAPIAAPVVSQAATGDDTSAATTTNEITNDNITTAVNALKGLLTDTTYGDNSTNGSYPAAVLKANYDAYQPVATYAGTGILNGTLSTQNSTVLGSSADKAADASMKVYAVDSNNNKINYTNYNTTLYNDVSKNNGSIKYYYQIKYNNTDGDAQTPVTGYFTLTNDNNYSEVKALNVTYTNPLNVAYGSRTVNAKLSSTIDGVVKDQNGNTIELDNDAATTVAGNLYKSLSAAIADKGTTDSDYFGDSTFGSENKTYYQPVTITLKAGKLGTDSDNNTVTANTILTNYLAGKDGYAVTVNGSAMSGQTEANLKATDTTLTFVREVKVSQNASWTTEDVKGVVTTKSDAAYYTLRDGDNATITNRALAKNTAWQTNAVRTDANGNKQYRVGADEWIDANNVTFSDSTSTGEGAYTDVKALNGKVVTAGPSGFVYPLFDDNGKQVTNRAVAGDTAWYTDKSAVNAEGTTVYHVATGEWLQGNNVTYTAY